MRQVLLTHRIADDVREYDGFPILDPLAIDHTFPPFAYREPVIFDFGEVSWIEHECLMYLGAVVRWRVAKGLETFFRLPSFSVAELEERQDSKVLTRARLLLYLRTWDFPQFIESVSGRPFRDLLTSDCIDSYDLLHDHLPDLIRVITTRGGGSEQFLPRHRLAITPIKMQETALKTATLEQERWLQSHMMSVLNFYLDGMGERIATSVVLEAVLNAASHPNAHMAFTSCQFSLGADRRRSDPHLVVVFWDDGMVIPETLDRQIGKGGDITSREFSAMTEDERLRVRVQDKDGLSTTEILESNHETIDMVVSRRGVAWTTAAAFLTGVTSSPGGGDEASVSDNRGLGLSLIRRTVIDLFGGSIEYMFGQYRMTMHADPEPSTYDVFLSESVGAAWPLAGNLMVVRIPLKRG